MLSRVLELIYSFMNACLAEIELDQSHFKGGFVFLASFLPVFREARRRLQEERHVRVTTSRTRLQNSRGSSFPFTSPSPETAAFTRGPSLNQQLCEPLHHLFFLFFFVSSALE